MQRFSPSDAAFEGFRVIRNHPGAVLAWVAVYLLIMLVIGGLVLALFGPQIAMMQAYSGQNAMPPDMALRFIGSLGLVFLLAIPFVLALAAVFINAVFRPVLRPTDKGLFYLKLGGDEGRLVLLMLCWFALGIAAEIAFVILLIAVGAGASAALSNVQPAMASARSPLIVFGLLILLFCVATWLFVRLSLAAPMTFAEKRVSVFGSWRVTKGKFWSLLGCYLLAWIFALMIGVLGWVVSVCAGAVISGDWTALSTLGGHPQMVMMKNNLSILTHLFTVAAIVQLVLSSLMNAISRIVMYAPLAAAYRDLAPAPPMASIDAEPFSDEPPPILHSGLVL
jgi:hypothetical protein